MTLPQLPGMQVMHALVGCQKRWINRPTRRFQSLDIMYFPMDAPCQGSDATIRFLGAVFQASSSARLLKRGFRPLNAADLLFSPFPSSPPPPYNFQNPHPPPQLP